MINTEGFTFGVMLGWMEVLGVTLCSGMERSSLPFIGNGEGRRPRMAPLVAYPPLTFCLLMSSSLASWSLNYINFPTKVVFRSCKLLPTMILAVIMGNAKRFTMVEVGSAIAVCAGLITFAAGDWSLSTPQFHPFGLTLVTLSVFADAILPNAQEKLFRTYEASKSEVMFFTNVFTLMVQTGSALLSGDMLGMYHFVMGADYSGDFELNGSVINSTEIIHHDGMNGQVRNLVSEKEATMIVAPGGSLSHGIKQKFLLCIVAYILISHVAVSAHTAVVKKFGGVAAVFVGTARKGMTLVLSFVLFPKESNWKYAVGAILVLGGLAIASLEKQKNKRNKDKEVDLNAGKGHSVDLNGMKTLLVPRLPLSSCADSSDKSSKDVELGRTSSTTSDTRRRLQ